MRRLRYRSTLAYVSPTVDGRVAIIGTDAIRERH